MKFTTIVSSIVGILFTGIGFGYLLTIEPSFSSNLFNNSLPKIGINIDTNPNKYKF